MYCHHRLFIVYISYGNSESAEHRVIAISHFKLEAIHFHFVVSSVDVVDFVAGQLQLREG